MIRDIREAPRPDHADFMTSAELKEIEFSGLRNNSLNNDLECWVLGELVFFVTPEETRRSPGAFHRKYEKHFMLHNVEKEN